jgi:hypothetical protein
MRDDRRMAGRLSAFVIGVGIGAGVALALNIIIGLVRAFFGGV